MIKINNKNITYVALADSNNSLKAPKEVWYADSSNSVKLVYRRKDALIEGEDYEKYHLLNGYTNEGATLPALGADIRVNAIPLDNKVFTIELGQISRNVLIYGQGIWFIPMWSYYSNKQYIMQLQERDGNNNTVHNINTTWTSSNIITLDFQNNTASIGNTSFSISGVGYKFDGFHSVSWQNPRTVGRIKISDELHLIPCKLLKPVPKWLDANGIRRQVGECGMIDLVSGKFYGNVNSVGTFTVENYYERKEHLVSTNAYIDTKLKNITDKNITISFSYASNTSVGILFGSEVVTPYNRITIGHYLVNAIYGIWLYDNKPGRQISEDYKNLTVILDATQSKTFVNGINITDYNPPQSELYDNILLFAYYRKQTIDSSAALITSSIGTMIDNFIVQNTMNLIPCTLTMDLPASMDANNIARTKGTSGMWDLVSDRFYGNVANSGTFKAVNLAEGVDYEVHQWLVEDGNAYIEGINYNLWDNTISLQIGKTNVRGNRYFTAKYLSITEDISSSPSYLMVIFRQNSDGIPHIADIHPYSSMPDVVTMDFYIENSLFYCNQNGVVKTNNPAQTAIESTWKSVASRIYSSKMSYIREVLPNGSYNSNLIPVKLLKSIPSKYDANGIARQAGECGMYDTVNDVFYGNVASSGTFTVDDDE